MRIRKFRAKAVDFTSADKVTLQRVLKQITEGALVTWKGETACLANERTVLLCIGTGSWVKMIWM